MTQVWSNFVVAGGGGCTCCGNNVVGCNFTLPTPILDADFTPPYANISVATSVIANNTAGCLIQHQIAGTTPTINNVNATVISAGILNVRCNYVSTDAAAQHDDELLRGYFYAASGITVTYALQSNIAIDFLQARVDLYLDDGYTTSNSQSAFALLATSISGSFNIPIPSDNYYYLEFINDYSVTGLNGAFTAFSNCTANGGTSANFCSIRAAYTNGNATDYLVCV